VSNKTCIRDSEIRLEIHDSSETNNSQLYFSMSHEQNYSQSPSRTDYLKSRLYTSLQIIERGNTYMIKIVYHNPRNYLLVVQGNEKSI
jgi:hypothetical protein